MVSQRTSAGGRLAVCPARPQTSSCLSTHPMAVHRVAHQTIPACCDMLIYHKAIKIKNEDEYGCVGGSVG